MLHKFWPVFAAAEPVATVRMLRHRAVAGDLKWQRSAEISTITGSYPGSLSGAATVVISARSRLPVFGAALMASHTASGMQPGIPGSLAARIPSYPPLPNDPATRRVRPEPDAVNDSRLKLLQTALET
jgi:hypothetical protein